MTYIFGDLGRSWSIFRDLGSKDKILLGSRGNYFQGSGEINAIFSGIKGAQTPLGGLTLTRRYNVHNNFVQFWYILLIASLYPMVTVHCFYASIGQYGCCYRD